MVEYAVVLGKGRALEEEPHLVHVDVGLQRIDGRGKAVRVGEVLVHEIKDHVAALGGVFGIHRDFSEKVAHLGMDHRERSQTVPEIVEGEDGFGSGARRLVFGAHERAPEFYGIWEIVAYERVGKAEQVGCGQTRASVGVKAYVGADYVAVAADDHLVFRVPDYKLAAGRVHQVEGVYVAVLPCASTGSAEGDFAQTAHLAHEVGARTSVEGVYDVSSLVGGAQLIVGSELGFEKRGVYRWYYKLLVLAHCESLLVRRLSRSVSFSSE